MKTEERKILIQICNEYISHVCYMSYPTRLSWCSNLIIFGEKYNLPNFKRAVLLTLIQKVHRVQNMDKQIHNASTALTND
jgi:hypothetical protein